MHLLENLNDDDDHDVDISRAWEGIRDNIKTSAKIFYFIMRRNSIKHGLMKIGQNYYIKESGLNCNGCRILVKQTEII
jgi:hypothetical protein